MGWRLEHRSVLRDRRTMPLRSPHPLGRPDPSLPRGNGELVLVVDDHPAIRDGTARLLTTVGRYVVADAASGAEALAIVRALNVRLVVADWRLPDMDGGTLLDQLRRERPSLPVLILTGYGPETIRDEWPALGPGTMVLAKPVTVQQLLPAVSSLLQTHAPAGVEKPIGEVG
ncbi:MAG TPA: response regulator [Gemmatimonadales bacterium]|nr:response regulator [Gemmatimonadales bacterium]